MYSATLNEKQVIKAEAIVREFLGDQARYFNPLLRYIDALKASIKLQQPGFDVLEEDCHPENILCAENFRALRHVPPNLLKSIRGLSFVLRELLDEIPDLKKKRELLDFYFSALFFL